MFTNRPANPERISTSPDLSDNGQRPGSQKLNEDIYRIRNEVQQKLLSSSEGDVNLQHQPEVRRQIERYFLQTLNEQNLIYSRAERDQILRGVISDILGYGPIEPLLQDETITEVMANGAKEIYIERFGIIEETDVVFEDDEHLMRIIDRIVSPIGRRVDESSPMVDARLPSGYRVNATIPPLSLDGPLLTIRKFAKTPYTVHDLIANKTTTSGLTHFLKACIEARVNMIISGGTGSGKTTLLNAVSAFIPSNERIVTIEDTAELQLKQRHVVRTEYRPPNIEGKGEVTIRRLVINALRMRPDRIIVGEARGAEALDMLQAMNTGHDGSLTTIHSNSPRDTLRRVETMVLMAGLELPLRAIREQLASAIELIVHMERLRDGTRRVVKVTEVQGMEGDSVVMQDLFSFEQTGLKNGRVIGAIKPNGLRPKFADKFAVNNIELPIEVFDPEMVGGD